MNTLYIPPEIIDVITDAIKETNITSPQILEPGLRTGVFNNSSTMPIPESNFFLKSVDMERLGGLVVFITSQYFLDSPVNRPLREKLMEMCDPVSIIRLPNNLLSNNAGNDLIILQKRSEPDLSISDKRKCDFIETRNLSNGISVNNTFQSFDRVVQTEAMQGADMYGKPAIVFSHKGGIEGIASSLYDMLIDDLSRNLDIKLYRFFAIEKNANETGYKPTGKDMAELMSYADEKDKLLWKENPPLPEMYTRNNHVAERQQPLISLYDLFDLSSEERTQLKRPQRRKPKEKPNTDPEYVIEWREQFNNERLQREKEEARYKEWLQIRKEQREEAISGTIQKDYRVSYSMHDANRQTEQTRPRRIKL